MATVIRIHTLIDRYAFNPLSAYPTPLWHTQKGESVRTLDQKEIAQVSGGADPITNLVSGILKAEWNLILLPIFNVLTFGAFNLTKI